MLRPKPVEANRKPHPNPLKEERGPSRHNDVVPLETIGVEALYRQHGLTRGAYDSSQ
jgi:hypothetical protein